MLNYNELEEILERITARVTLANRTGELEELLEQWGFDDLISSKTVSKLEDYNGKKCKSKKRDINGRGSLEIRR